MTPVGICGWMGAGKDTAAQVLVDEFGYRRDSFAAPLKDTVSAVFGWDRELVEGDSPESRKWREEIDVWWSRRLGIPDLTPRKMLQNWGTNLCRDHFHLDIWIASLEKRMLEDRRVVITDVRFENEVNILKSRGTKLIWVKRGPLPEWYWTAVRVLQGNAPPGQMVRAFPQVHPSEWCWVASGFDLVIENDREIEDLKKSIREFTNLFTNPQGCDRMVK